MSGMNGAPAPVVALHILPANRSEEDKLWGSLTGASDVDHVAAALLAVDEDVAAAVLPYLS